MLDTDRPGRWRRFAAPLVLLVGFPACDACERTKPFTPYKSLTAEGAGGEPTTPAGSADPGAAGAPDPAAGAPGTLLNTDTGPEADKMAVRAPQGATEWTHGTATIQAPEGQVFEWLLPGPLSLDRTPGIAAFTLPKGAQVTAGVGELWWYPANSPPRLLLETPGFIPSGEGCSHHVTLSRTGLQSMTLEVSARCSTKLLPRAPVRAVLVLSTIRRDPVLAGLRVSQMPSGGHLAFQVDSTDHDGDQLDDVIINVSLRRAGVSASVRLAWYDRAAGPARDGSLPALDFADVVKTGFQQAVAQGEKNLPERAAVLRRLWSLLCAESGTPGVVDLEGGAFQCSAGEALHTLRSLEITGLLKEGEPVKALGVFERDGWMGPGLSSQKKRELGGQIQDALKRYHVKGLFTVNERPVSADGTLRWSPLAFVGNSDLLVRGAHRVVKFRLPNGPEESAETTMDPWPLTIQSGDGLTVRNLILPCDSPELAVLAATRSGKLVQLPVVSNPEILSPRPGQCVGLGTASTPDTTIVGWSNSRGGLKIGLTATEALVPMRPSPHHSASDMPMVMPTSLGMLVLSGGQAALWQGPEVRSGGLTDCVASPDGLTMACIRDQRAILFHRGDAI